ncbi:hypothetical protein R3Q06_27590 [Rhodococcus erythropolis]|uniref:hypothetical protein n=1 Tax=Rhodococcus erythropolis TaxID=1833 RepID=UPI002949B471|nr:hypothetical protein [Rhodococcus erythropolis]MDV6277264.1 hypothetical protein [Rhodococcus erythropolis]
MTEMTLAEYKAQVDARYANATERTKAELDRLAAERAEGKRKDHWLLVGPNGEIDGVMTRRFAKSAAEAFDTFFESKKERYAASAEGWHIEDDDENGSQWAASCEAHKAAK